MSKYKGSGALTREQFLFHETRIVARLMSDEQLSDDEIEKIISDENLFQFPTEKSVHNITRGCLRRLHGLNSDSLVSVIAHGESGVAKQACLYAIMKQYGLVWDFMVTVIGAKYCDQDFSYGRIDINVFFSRLQEQDDEVALWADSTVKKLKSVLNRLLIENGYIDSSRVTKLNPVLLAPEVEKVIRSNGDEKALPAFNCFS